MNLSIPKPRSLLAAAKFWTFDRPQLSSVFCQNRAVAANYCYLLFASSFKFCPKTRKRMKRKVVSKINVDNDFRSNRSLQETPNEI